MSEYSELNNRATAKRLTKSIVFCKCEQCQETVEDKIFTELQKAQKLGETIAKMGDRPPNRPDWSKSGRPVA